MATEAYVKPAIQQIVQDPRYPEFARQVTECGRMVVPDAFPWRYMGVPDEEFLAVEHRYATGEPAPREQKCAWLAVVRRAEQDVVEWWSWWLGGEYLTRPRVLCGPRPAPVQAAAAGEQGMLF